MMNNEKRISIAFTVAVTLGIASPFYLLGAYDALDGYLFYGGLVHQASLAIGILVVLLAIGTTPPLKSLGKTRTVALILVFIICFTSYVLTDNLIKSMWEKKDIEYQTLINRE